MGTQVAVPTDTTRKTDMTLTSVAAAAATVGQSELGIFIGATIEGTRRRAEIFEALRACANKLREAGNPIPTSTNFNVASVDVDATTLKSGVVVALNQASLSLSETDVAVYYRSLFQPMDGADITKAAMVAGDLWRETIK